jgi:hypothetical protein
MSAENAIRDLYERLIRGWNAGDRMPQRRHSPPTA